MQRSRYNTSIVWWSMEEESQGVELACLDAQDDRDNLPSNPDPGASDVSSGYEVMNVTNLPLTKMKSTLKKFRKIRASYSTDDCDSSGLKKELNLFFAVAYVVGTIIGSGIFITPQTILCRTGSFGTSLIVWVIGGIAAMGGGLCYIELGLLIRKSGAEYSFIKEAYSFKKKYLEVIGSLLSFLYIWCSVFVIRSSSLAVITLTSAEYLIRPFYIHCSDNIPNSAVKLISLSLISKL